MNRRETLQTLAALAAGRWASEGWDPDEMENWDEIGGGVYNTTELDLASYYASVNSVVLHWEEADRFEAGKLVVAYDEKDVTLITAGEAELFDASSLVELDPDQAREVAVALYQAAEEHERRPRGEGWS